jgi:hypothetical protein
VFGIQQMPSATSWKCSLNRPVAVLVWNVKVAISPGATASSLNEQGRLPESQVGCAAMEDRSRGSVVPTRTLFLAHGSTPVLRNRAVNAPSIDGPGLNVTKEAL